MIAAMYIFKLDIERPEAPCKNKRGYVVVRASRIKQMENSRMPMECPG